MKFYTSELLLAYISIYGYLVSLLYHLSYTIQPPSYLTKTLYTNHTLHHDHITYFFYVTPIIHAPAHHPQKLIKSIFIIFPSNHFSSNAFFLFTCPHQRVYVTNPGCVFLFSWIPICITFCALPPNYWSPIYLIQI